MMVLASCDPVVLATASETHLMKLRMELASNAKETDQEPGQDYPSHPLAGI